MNQAATGDYVPGQPGNRFDPYVRLMRALLPRTSCIAMFGPSGELIWSTDPMTGPDLMNVIDDALLGAGANPGLAGQLRLIEGNQPVYLCSMRDEQQQLMAVLAVLTRPSDAQERKVPDFSFVYSLLAPALECLRRDLLAQRTIEDLNQTVGGLDKDLNLLLSQGAEQTPQQASDGANELQHLLQQTIEHLHACTGALLVPEKSVTLVRSGDALAPPDTQFLMRAHRRLLALAQSQREPVVSNDTQSPENPDGFHYRVLCCALHSRAGRSIGVLVLLREPTAEELYPLDSLIY
jgi:hypothetical protein